MILVSSLFLSIWTCLCINSVYCKLPVVVQDLAVIKETLPLVLPGGSEIHFVNTKKWPLKWLVQNGADGKWLNDSRYMFGCYDFDPPVVPYYPEKFNSSEISEKNPKEIVVLDTHIIYLYFVTHIYHLLMETMPQIYSLYLNSIFAIYPNATILCANDLANNASKNIISALGIDMHADRFMYVKIGVTYKTDATHSLILPVKSRLFTRDEVGRSTKAWFLRAIGDRIPPNPHPKEQIYISRAGNRRHMLNETVMLNILQKHIKLTVYNRLEELSATEQWAIFGNASLVIAPHGAAITNTMFSNKDQTTVIEVSGIKHTGSFRYDVDSYGIKSYHNICVNNTANLDLIFDPHAVAKEILHFLKGVHHPIHYV